MTSRGKKKHHRGAAHHGPGGSQNTAATSRNRSPSKSPQKTSPSKRLPPSRTWDRRPCKERFGAGDTMDSAQRMVDKQRQKENYLSQVEYCSAPPTGEDLVPMRLVIPGDHLVPKALGDLDSLDDIRRDHKVWITREEGSETFLDVSASDIKSLRSALDAINARIHDMRLAEESLAAHFFVQPMRAQHKDHKIRFEIKKRPAIQTDENFSSHASHVTGGLSTQFASALPSAFKTLLALSSLKMHVNFGHFYILAKRKNIENLLSAEEFKSALDLYSSRGRGAIIQTESLDWNLRVDSQPNSIGERSGKLPEETAKFVRSLFFKTGQKANETNGGIGRFGLPRWQISNRGELALALSNFQVKSCVRTQYRDTPYEIETTVTQHWARLPTCAKPERLSWSVSVSGIHWEEALSEYKTGKSLNGCEEGLHRMWPGEGSLEERLEEFLECVFSVQAAMAEFVTETGRR
ncbi:hypothetical protein PWT90_04778 [Aphanocladium album]|nr:hypothetical protein PWT90_04778 [Aphanocladium album]